MIWFELNYLWFWSLLMCLHLTNTIDLQNVFISTAVLSNSNPISLNSLSHFLYCCLFAWQPLSFCYFAKWVSRLESSLPVSIPLFLPFFLPFSLLFYLNVINITPILSLSVLLAQLKTKLHKLMQCNASSFWWIWTPLAFG